MIPKRIHYCWFGPNEPDELMSRCLASWRTVLPDYEIKQWNESNSRLDSMYARRAYSEKAWAYLSDYVRLDAVYREGGIYLDTDVEVIRSFDRLLDDNCFLGFQLEENHCDWVGNAVFGATAANPFIKKWLDQTLEGFERTLLFDRAPLVVTRLLRRIGLKQYGMQRLGDVTLYPREYFYPYAWFEEFSLRSITEATHAVHHWAGSWMNPSPPQLKILLLLRQMFAR